MLILILLLIATVVYYFGINRILGLPPGPPPLPLIGNMLSFRWDLDRVLLDWKARYGRIFTVWLPYPMVVIGDHKVLQEHVVRNGDVFVAKRNPEEITKMMSGGLLGLVFEDNDIVKEQRKFALRSFHEIGFGSAALEDTVHNIALEVASRWRNTGGASIDVSENIEKAVGNTVWGVTFGSNLDFNNGIVPEFRQVQKDMMPLMAGPLIMFLEMVPSISKLDFLFGNRLKKLQALMDKTNVIVADAIRGTENTFNIDDQPGSYVEAFLREMKKNDQTGKSEGNFHYKQLQSAAITLWGAGFDTTVGLLRMCILELINHPEVQRKLQDEIDSAIGERRIRYDDQKQLPYLCAFLQEVYRLGNVLPINFIRKTSQRTTIEGLSIPAGTNILPQFSMVHADSNEFERPEYFCLERHIDDGGRFIKDPRITPFSVGKRACLGETLARMEIFVMVATIVQHCNFAPVDKVPPPVEFDHGFTRCVKPFNARVTARD